MNLVCRFPSIVAAALFCLIPLLHAQQTDTDEARERALRHATVEWATVADHLPNPDTASTDTLIQAGDILRARRLPEDAIDFYQFALRRGAPVSKVENSLGVTYLELRRYAEARACLKLAVQAEPKNAQNWNNLGAVEFVSGNTRLALANYLRAIKLNKKGAVFHSNLGTAYFEMKDYESARSEFERAQKLDANVFHSGGFAGVEAHVLGSSDHGRFCFEMAKMSARQHDFESMLRWLARSSESGFDVRELMAGDKDFDPYYRDPRVATVIRNAKAMRTGQIADSGLAPAIPESARP
jgi:tetratricopeptide (TPR) repeat protein